MNSENTIIYFVFDSINENDDRSKSIWDNFLDKMEEGMFRVLSARDSIRDSMTSDKKFRNEFHVKMCSQ